MSIQEITGLNYNRTNYETIDNQASEWNGFKVTCSNDSNTKIEQIFQRSTAIQEHSSKVIFNNKLGGTIIGSGSIETNSNGDTTGKIEVSIGDKSKDGKTEVNVTGSASATIDKDGKLTGEGKIQGGIKHEF